MEINILVTLNEAYIPHLNTMLLSLINSNKRHKFNVYLLHSSINESSLNFTRYILGISEGELIPINANEKMLESAPTTDRFPKEMYYRIFAAKYLPEHVDRIIYMDPDIIVNGNLESVYRLNMDGYYFAAASHNGSIMRAINGKRLNMKKGAPYINSGFLVINLETLRKEQHLLDVFDFIEENKKRLILPDQDIISTLYGEKVLELDTYIYNMTERQYRYSKLLFRRLNVGWIRQNSVIIHYCGKNKPWREKYRGRLNVFYDETLKELQGLRNRATIE